MSKTWNGRPLRRDDPLVAAGRAVVRGGVCLALVAVCLRLGGNAKAAVGGGCGERPAAALVASAIGDSPLWTTLRVAKEGQSPKAPASREMSAQPRRAFTGVAPKARQTFPAAGATALDWARACQTGTVPHWTRACQTGTVPRWTRACQTGTVPLWRAERAKGDCPLWQAQPASAPTNEPAPAILRIERQDSEGSPTKLADGTVFRGDLAVTLEHPCVVDADATCVLLYDAQDASDPCAEVRPLPTDEGRDTSDEPSGEGDSSSDEGSALSDEPDDGDTSDGAGGTEPDDGDTSDGADDTGPDNDSEAGLLTDLVCFDLPEGSYARMVVRVVDADGHEATATYVDVAVDRTAPSLAVRAGGRTVRDGDLIAGDGRVELSLAEAHPQRDEQGAVVLDVRLCEEWGGAWDVPGVWASHMDGATHVLALTDADGQALPDGSYTLTVQGRDEAGNRMEAVTCAFVIDTQAPTVSLDLDAQARLTRREAVAYANERQVMRVRVSDRHLDLRGTEVCGVPLAELLEGAQVRGEGGVLLGAWTSETDGRGVRACEGTIALADGSYAVSDLVRATDAARHETCSTLAQDGRTIDALVVDTCAPAVRASVGTAPVRVFVDDNEREHAFFGTDTVLRLELADVGGIADIRLDTAGVARDHVLHGDAEGQVATIALGEDAFVADETVTVTDWAGNATTWSLGPQVVQRTHAGTAPAPDAALVATDTGRPVGATGHPATLVADTTAPTLWLGGVDEGAYVRAATTLRARAADRNLAALATYDGSQPLVSVTKDGEPWRQVGAGAGAPNEAGDERAYELVVPARPSHEDDGDYAVSVALTDLSGNHAELATRSFVVDTTPPVLAVAFDDGGDGGAGARDGHFARRRVAHLTLTERNVTADELNAPDSLVRIEPQARDGRASRDVEVGTWRRDEQTGAFVCDVSFVPGGTYELVVSGADKAGNVLVGATGTTVDETGRYASGAFVVDDEAPTVVCAYAAGTPQPATLGSADYYRSPVTLSIGITDQALDVERTTVVDSEGVARPLAWRESERAADGRITYTASLTYAEGEPGTGSGEKRPTIVAVDCAGNVRTVQPLHFVVDQTAPRVESATMDGGHTVEATGEGDDPYWFYGAQEGAGTTLTIALSDEYGLDAVWVDDPDEAYGVRAQDVRGQRQATLALRLKDGVADDAQHDTALDRSVRLLVRDLAGNVRAWTIDRTGEVVAERADEGANVSLNGLGLFPHALVRDTTPPKVALAGVESGAYYREPQVARVQVDEHNLGYLARFYPGRVVLSVECRSADADGIRTSWTVPVQRLEGTAPLGHVDQPLAADGHYRLVASLVDVAGNESAVISRDEVTIDTTPPVIAVSWDNMDARNGSHYRAARTATIRVTEHNFDQAQFAVETTGRVGAWDSAGDVHTCVVTFDRDATMHAPHTLTVSGRDRAGNEAVPYEETPFAIDTQAPTIAVERRTGSGNERYEVTGPALPLVGESAFAQAVMPVVTLSDEAGLDPARCEVSLTGTRSGAAEAFLAQRREQAEGETALVVDWGNLGLEETADGARYRLDADDIYTIRATVCDWAGNECELEPLVFSVNRYGSNFYVEELAGADAMTGAESDTGLLLSSPTIVVHEVNVSGAAEADPDGAHIVTKEYANATSTLRPAEPGGEVGYTLVASTQASERNPYDGWSEYVYRILPGNFGAGSDSDYGDGGQGRYRVDVSSRDRAENNNTTARYWESDALRERDPRDKTATVAFTLDEFGPALELTDVPGPLEVGESFRATLRVTDDITNGDDIAVLVDGEPVDVWREGDAEPLRPGAGGTSPGTFSFLIGAKPLLVPRTVEIRVADYTGLQDRVLTRRIEGFGVTTLRTEAALVGGVAVALVVAWRVVRRVREHVE